MSSVIGRPGLSCPALSSTLEKRWKIMISALASLILRCGFQFAGTSDRWGDVAGWSGSRGGRGGGGSGAFGAGGRPGNTGGLSIDCGGGADGTAWNGAGDLIFRTIVSARVGRRNGEAPGTVGRAPLLLRAEFGGISGMKPDLGALMPRPVLRGEGTSEDSFGGGGAREESFIGGGGGSILSLEKDDVDAVVEAELGTGETEEAVLPLLVLSESLGGLPVRDIDLEIFEAGVAGVCGVWGVRGVRGDLMGVGVREGCLLRGDMISLSSRAKMESASRCGMDRARHHPLGHRGTF